MITADTSVLPDRGGGLARHMKDPPVIIADTSVLPDRGGGLDSHMKRSRR